jgi:hypothetical protein
VVDESDELSELAHTYLSTIVTVRHDQQWYRAAQAVALMGGSYFVITAWNPGEERLTLEENRRRNEELRHNLEASGAKIIAALGSDPNSSYHEESWAVSEVTMEQVMEHARAWDQVAIFWVTEQALHVVGCDSSWGLARPHN